MMHRAGAWKPVEPTEVPEDLSEAKFRKVRGNSRTDPGASESSRLELEDAEYFDFLSEVEGKGESRGRKLRYQWQSSLWV